MMRRAGLTGRVGADFSARELNQNRSSALNSARARWQPVATGKMDAADFAGFWLRHQRIGKRYV
jgi:hypothetical protein